MNLSVSGRLTWDWLAQSKGAEVAQHSMLKLEFECGPNFLFLTLN